MFTLRSFKHFDALCFAKFQNGHVFVDIWVNHASAEYFCQLFLCFSISEESPKISTVIERSIVSISDISRSLNFQILSSILQARFKQISCSSSPFNHSQVRKRFNKSIKKKHNDVLQLSKIPNFLHKTLTRHKLYEKWKCHLRIFLQATKQILS